LNESRIVSEIFFFVLRSPHGSQGLGLWRAV
jgi:hypothetical protein